MWTTLGEGLTFGKDVLFVQGQFLERNSAVSPEHSRLPEIGEVSASGLKNRFSKHTVVSPGKTGSKNSREKF